MKSLIIKLSWVLSALTTLKTDLSGYHLILNRLIHFIQGTDVGVLSVCGHNISVLLQLFVLLTLLSKFFT